MKGKIIHSNNFFSVEKRKIVKGGHSHYINIIHKKSVVHILAILDNGNIILERQFRPPVGKYIYEIPAGHIDEGETKKQTALRELEEETGYRAGKISKAITMYAAPGIMEEKSYLYIARDLKKGKSSLGVNEDLSVLDVSLDTALKMIKSNRIMDAKTIASILYYKEFIA